MAQLNNKNSYKGHKARQALEMAVKNDGADKEVIESMQVLYDIWKVQLAKALEGDQAATNAIMDRLDGKPGQSLMLSGDEDNPIVTKVERVIVKHKD